jgi:hypothetical protein
MTRCPSVQPADRRGSSPSFVVFSPLFVPGLSPLASVRISARRSNSDSPLAPSAPSAMHRRAHRNAVQLDGFQKRRPWSRSCGRGARCAPFHQRAHARSSAYSARLPKRKYAGSPLRAIFLPTFAHPCRHVSKTPLLCPFTASRPGTHFFLHPETTAPLPRHWGTSRKGRAVFRREDRW